MLELDSMGALRCRLTPPEAALLAELGVSARRNALDAARRICPAYKLLATADPITFMFR